MIGKWVYLIANDGDHFTIGEVVAMHGEHYCEVRPVVLDGRDPDAASEPPHTYIIPMSEFAIEGSRVFPTEQALHDWLAWCARPETLSEARKRLRPVS
ncbi:MAG: hypothetical protein ACREML_04550 [Vulcanimicrobiaceae bacterium]